MLRIRLRRVGKKGKPSYRIVVAEASAPRDGAYLEWIGNYDPMADPPAFSLKEDRATHWLSKGAQPSDAVMRILDKNGIIQRTPVMRTRTRAAGVEDVPSIAVRAVAATAVVDVEQAVEDEAAAVDEVPTEDEAAAVDEVATEDEAAAVDEVATEDEAAAVDEVATEDEASAVDEVATEDEAVTVDEVATEDEAAAVDEGAAVDEAATDDEAPAEGSSDEDPAA